MKILQVVRPDAFSILDLPTPMPGPDEVLMRVDAVTTCPQWDLHLKHNEPMFVGHSFQYPYTPGQPGHEATGEIAAIGSNVTGLRVGDRVSTRNTARAEAAWTYLREYMGEENFLEMWARDGSPARRSAWPAFAEIWHERNPNVNIYAFMDAMSYGEYVRPLGVEAGRIARAVQEGLWLILHDELSPLAGAQKMHDEITAILSSTGE